MKQILIEIDDRTARELERVAPTRKRLRAEFIRLAIRRALDLALDRSTAEAYRTVPLAAGSADEDLAGWDAANQLATVEPRRAPKARTPKARSRAA